MNWEILTNPYVLGGGLILGLALMFGRGQKASTGPSFAEISTADLAQSRIALDYSKNESQRLTTQSGQYLSAFTSITKSQIDANVQRERSYNGMTTSLAFSTDAKRVADNENFNLTQRAFINDRGATQRTEIGADQAKYIARKQANASIWKGALEIVPAIAKIAATAAGAPPI